MMLAGDARPSGKAKGGVVEFDAANVSQIALPTQYKIDVLSSAYACRLTMASSLCYDGCRYRTLLYAVD